MLNKNTKKILSFLVIGIMLSFGLVWAGHVMAAAGDPLGVTTVGAQTGLGVQDIRITIGNIIRIILGLLGAVAIVLVMYGGFLYMTAGGDETKIGKAKKVLINAAIGLVIIFSAYAIVSFVTSRLLQATGANDQAVQVLNKGCVGCLSIESINTLVSRAISPSADIKIRNVKVRVSFSKDVKESTITANTVKITDDQANVIPGEMVVSGKRVTFTPDAACPEPNQILKCFASNTHYNVALTPKTITSNDGIELSCAGNSVCLAAFTTGDLIDVTPPTVHFISLLNDDKVSVDDLVDVTIGAEDDSGVSNIALVADGSLVDEQGFDGGTPKESTFAWDTTGLSLGFHNLKAEASDIDDHSADGQIRVKILPAECFVGGVVQCGNPACGVCENGPCKVDSDCAAGFYCLVPAAALEGQCKALPVVRDVSPAEGAVGNLITIFGSGFQNFVNGTSKVLFTSGFNAQNQPTYIEAANANCGVSAWTDTQILTKVPVGAITGPIKVINKDGRYDSTDNPRGWDDDFVLNPKLVNPGLCSVLQENCVCDPADPDCGNCKQGDIRQNVKAAGERLGSSGDGAAVFANYHVYFGEQASALGDGGSWSETEIRNVQIPNLNPAGIKVVVGKGERCLDKTTLDTCVKGIDGCICAEIYSNPINFHIAAITTLPTIANISPVPTHQGQVITIAGSNFGKAVGAVTLTVAGGNPVVLPAGCDANSWSDTEVVVKLPDQLDAAIYKIVLTTSDRLATEPTDLTIEAGVPGPAICSFSPSNGPHGTAVSLGGKNFGGKDDYKIYFAKTGVADDPGTAVSNADMVWTESLITKAMVPQDAVSGAVYLSNAGKTVKSNNRKFTVGSCSGSSCGEGNKCCANGTCVLAADTCTDANQGVKPSEFAWVVSTGTLPMIPQILERSCVVGASSQSPSPFKGETVACPNGMISGTFNQEMNKASLSGNIVIKRCSQPVGTRRCEGATALADAPCTDATPAPCKCTVDLGACNLDVCVATDCVSSTVTAVNADVDVGTTNSAFACTKDVGGADCKAGDAGCTCRATAESEPLTEFHLYSSFAANNDNLFEVPASKELFKNTWYSVTVTGGDAGVKNTVAPTPDSMPRDYTWKFKTQGANCVPDKLLMSPLKGLLDSISAEQAYMVSGQFKCETIPMPKTNWSWLANDPERITGLSRAALLRNGGIDRQDIGIFGINDAVKSLVIPETKSEKLIKIWASAVVNGQGTLKGNVSKEGDLEIKFESARVVAVEPVCVEACINAEIVATFNTEMRESSFTFGAGDGASVMVYECPASDCVVLGDRVVLSSLLVHPLELVQGSDKMVSQIFVGHGNFQQNKYYRVILKNSIVSATGGALGGVNYDTALNATPVPNAYSWIFKTRDSAVLCKLDKVKVSPENYISTTAGEKIEYLATPLSAGDGCSKEGQTLNPFDYTWDWSDIANANVAVLTRNFLAPPLETYCTGNCLSMGSLPYGGVCGNGKIEIGEECDDRNVANNDGCSEFCLKEEAKICDDLKGTNCCGNGGGGETYTMDSAGNVLDLTVLATQKRCASVPASCIARVEECDFGCEYKDNSGKACAKGSNNCLCVSKESSCDYGCLNAGTAKGFVCGNGKIEPGEDCDDGNKVAGDGCSAKCLNEGAKYKVDSQGVAPAVCGDGNIQGGEECEVNCKIGGAGVACNRVEANCVCVNNPLCTANCLWSGFSKCVLPNKDNCCGNGLKDVGEECEAVCTKERACGNPPGEDCVNGKEKVTCALDEAGCKCVFPAGCNDKCLHTGSSLAAGSVCRNRILEAGEDTQCDETLAALEGLPQSPQQIVLVVGNIAMEAYDEVNHYKQATTPVSVTGEGAGIRRQGTTPLTYRDFSCHSTDVTIAAGAVPASGATGICRNAMIYIPLDQKIAAEGFSKTQVSLRYMTRTIDGTCLDSTADWGPWFDGGETNGCRVAVEDAKIIEENGKSVILITPSGLLNPTAVYNWEIGGLKDSCGASFELMGTNFTTGNQVCRITGVTLTPAEMFITIPKAKKGYLATPEGSNQFLHGVADVYDWNWVWEQGSGDIITSMSILENKPNERDVITGLKNGKTTVTAIAEISVDTLGGKANPEVCQNNTTRASCSKGAVDCVCTTAPVATTVGAGFSGVGNIEVFICSNVWGPTDGDYTANKWRANTYEAENGENVITHLVETTYNVGLFYCRDAGKVTPFCTKGAKVGSVCAADVDCGDGGVCSSTSADDLPKLQQLNAGDNLLEAGKRRGVYFDDTNDWMKVADGAISPDVNFDNAGQSWTVEAWVFNDIMPQGLYKRVFYKNIVTTTGENNVQLYIKKVTQGGNDVRVVGFGIKNSSVAVNISKMVNNVQLPLGFNHLALAYDGGAKTATLFINGAGVGLVDTGMPGTYNGNKDFYVGSRGEYPGTSFGGYVDDFRIWNVAKTGAQVLQTWNKILKGDEQNLVAYWMLNNDVLDRSKNGHNNLASHCTVEAAPAKSRCNLNAEGKFQFISLSDLAADNNLPEGTQMTTIQNEDFNQCMDGIDNDHNGLIDFAGANGAAKDPKCVDDKDKWEEPQMLSQYFFKRDDKSSDVISMRIYENPESLPPDLWYQNYVPNPSASTTRTEVDCTSDDNLLVTTCYVGAKDGASTYIAAANYDSTNKKIFGNIYLLGYSQGSDETTLNIYNQLLKFVRFNMNLVTGDPGKLSIMQDERRVTDIVYLRLLLDNYKKANGGKVPSLAGGTYVRGRTLSVWPSWQDELGKALGAGLPMDPDNHFLWVGANAENAGKDCGAKKCPNDPATAYQCVIADKYCVKCPVGSAKETCYNSSNQTFTEVAGQINPLYSYKANVAGTCYELKYNLENLAPVVYNVVPELRFVCQ